MDGLTQSETADSSQTGDGDLQRRIVNFLLERGLPSLRYLEVEVRAGVVVVKGQVRTYYEKQLATCCCQRVAGVLRIVNDAQVVERRSQPPVSDSLSCCGELDQAETAERSTRPHGSSDVYLGGEP